MSGTLSRASFGGVLSAEGRVEAVVCDPPHPQKKPYFFSSPFIGGASSAVSVPSWRERARRRETKSILQSRGNHRYPVIGQD